MAFTWSCFYSCNLIHSAKQTLAISDILQSKEDMKLQALFAVMVGVILIFQVIKIHLNLAKMNIKALKKLTNQIAHWSKLNPLHKLIKRVLPTTLQIFPICLMIFFYQQSKMSQYKKFLIAVLVNKRQRLLFL